MVLYVPPGVIPERRIRNKPQGLPDVALKQNKNKESRQITTGNMEILETIRKNYEQLKENTLDNLIEWTDF